MPPIFEDRVSIFRQSDPNPRDMEQGGAAHFLTGRKLAPSSALRAANAGRFERARVGVSRFPFDAEAPAFATAPTERPVLNERGMPSGLGGGRPETRGASREVR